MYAMEKIISVLLITCALVFAKPIHRGYTVKFNPILLREYILPKTFGSLFKKISYEVSQDALKQDFVTKCNSTNFFNCSDDAAKVLFPAKRVELSNETGAYENLFDIPSIPQQLRDYNIIVVAAPWHLRISGDEANPSVIYIVFPGDDGDSKSINIPAIYFVRKTDGLPHLTERLNKGSKIDPVIIVDSNRTVTGLKSNEVPKYVKFKSKLLKGMEKWNLSTKVI